MKGIQGLILALGLGVAGAMFNWAYLHQEAANLEIVQFVGINPDVTVNPGDKLTLEHLKPVGIPAGSVANLRDYAFLWVDHSTVLSRPVHRTLTGGSLLMRDDLKTPLSQLVYGENVPEGVEECVMWVPVDPKSVATSLLVPGDEVYFVLSRVGVPTPAPAPGGSEEEAAERPPEDAPRPAGDQEMVGPFKILALGSRTSSAEVWSAWGRQSANENLLAIPVRLNKGQLEPKARKLWGLLQATNFRNVGILLRQRKGEGK